MRTFNLVSAWFFWLICTFYALGSLYMRGVNTIRPPGRLPEHLDSFTQQYWIALAVCTVLAAVIYYLRHRVWFQERRNVGWGFWAVSMAYYLFTLFVTMAGYAPYFLGDRSSIQWVSSLFGLVFTGMGFPNLPGRSASSPPPMPANPNPPRG